MVERWIDSDSLLVYIGGLVLVLAALVGVISALVLGVAYITERTSCSKTLNAMQRDGKYGIWTGCLVANQDGTYIPLDKWRAIAEDKP